MVISTKNIYQTHTAANGIKVIRALSTKNIYAGINNQGKMYS